MEQRLFHRSLAQGSVFSEMKNVGNSKRVKQIQTQRKRSKVGQNRGRGRPKGKDKGKNIEINNIEIRPKRSQSKPATHNKGMIYIHTFRKQFNS